MAKLEQEVLNDCEFDRDPPGALHHRPTTARPYATLSPTQVLQARKILQNAHGQLPSENAEGRHRDAT